MSDQRSMPSANESKQIFMCGFPEEWKNFEERHRNLLERYHNLSDTMNMAFIRRALLKTPIDKFVFQYGRLCCEDFHEIFLACGNGYGIAALKLLRTFYEHAVELCYLSEHPEELSAFLDYAYVAQHKILKPILDTFGSNAIAPSLAEEVERKFNEVKEKFLVNDCKKCGTKRLNHRWSKLDFVALAKKTDLGNQIVPGYFIPLRHAHATAASVESRLEELKDGAISFVAAAQRDEADMALMEAHAIILKVLEVQDKHFALSGLHDKLQICMQDFLDIRRS